MNVEEADIKLNEPTGMLVPPLKRTRDEMGNTQSDDGETGSDEEFGWFEDNALTTADNEVPEPQDSHEGKP